MVVDRRVGLEESPGSVFGFSVEWAYLMCRGVEMKRSSLSNVAEAFEGCVDCVYAIGYFQYPAQELASFWSDMITAKELGVFLLVMRLRRPLVAPSRP